jgi:hypothetical protein
MEDNKKVTPVVSTDAVAQVKKTNNKKRYHKKPKQVVEQINIPVEAIVEIKTVPAKKIGWLKRQIAKFNKWLRS